MYYSFWNKILVQNKSLGVVNLRSILPFRQNIFINSRGRKKVSDTPANASILLVFTVNFLFV